MFHRKNVILRRGTGIAVPGATVTVYVNGTDTAGDYAAATKAPIFSDAAGLNSILNSIVTSDANGEYEYFVAGGVYDEVLKYGSITDVDDFIQMFDVSGTISPDWGHIGGNIADQADLATALAGKVAAGALNELIDDRVAALLVAGANVTLTYDDAAGTLSIASSGGGGSAAPTVVSKSATYSESATSGELVILCTGTFTINLPTAVGNTAKIHVKCLSGAVTVDPSGTQTIDGGATAVVNVAGASITIVSDGSNWEIV